MLQKEGYLFGRSFVKAMTSSTTPDSHSYWVSAWHQMTRRATIHTYNQVSELQIQHSYVLMNNIDNVD